MTLAATGGILGEALLAADSLAERGIFCRVLSVHTIKPLDTDTLMAAASETGGIISIEEHAVDGGMGGAIAESLMEAGAFPGFFIRMGLRNTFSAVVGSQKYLRKVYSLDAASIIRTVSVKLGIASEVCSHNYQPRSRPNRQSGGELVVYVCGPDWRSDGDTRRD